MYYTLMLKRSSGGRRKVRSYAGRRLIYGSSGNGSFGLDTQMGACRFVLFAQ
jgi:hypothetical protein